MENQRWMVEFDASDALAVDLEAKVSKLLLKEGALNVSIKELLKMSEKQDTAKAPNLAYPEITVSLLFKCGGWSIPTVNRLIEKVAAILEHERCLDIEHIGMGLSQE